MGKKSYVNDIYQGGYSSLSPTYGYGDVFTGYRTSTENFGLTTDPRTANILQDASAKLSTGVKQIELTGVSPEIFESIPKKHLKEINRLSKLTGIDVSLHGPIVEPSGITKEGFTESGREAVERQMNLVVERSHELNPAGNVPVTFHSSAILPSQITESGKEPEETFIINSDSGSIHRIPIKKREFPGEKEINVDKEIKNINNEQWFQTIRSLSYYTEMGEDAIDKSGFLKIVAEAEERAGKKLSPEEERARSVFNMGANYLNDSYRQLKELFELAYKHGTNKEREVLNQFSKNIEKDALKIQQNPTDYQNVYLMRNIIDRGINTFREIITPPQLFQRLDEFSKDKTAQTFANIALNSYKKFGNNAPIISIENPPVGLAFSRGEELKEIVETARNKFVETAQKQGMSSDEARTAAEKVLGVTWDVGHINMLRKYGYKEEDVIKETEKVAKLVKHIHLSDNFGFEHTELPMGMGNVPIKEIMKKLPEKDVKKIIEAASWWQHFKTAPVKETYEAFGSPIYSMYMAPSWNQTLGFWQGYYGGIGAVFPQINYETVGAGFSQLPTELGGQRPGTQGGRMAGRPME